MPRSGGCLRPKWTFPVAYAATLVVCIGCSGVEGAARSDGGRSTGPVDGGPRPPSNDGAPHPGSGAHGSITGHVQGTAFSEVQSAFWIGKPAQGSLPMMLFLSDVALGCDTLSAEGWDKALGDGQLLEMAVAASTPGTYRIGVDADANYVRGAYNPTADGVTITIGMVDPMRSAIGSFELSFGSDALKGTFDAAWCADGVEP
jgi:hypothetical protein